MSAKRKQHAFQMPWEASDYTIQLQGVFRDDEGQEWKIGRRINLRAEALQRENVEAYLRSVMEEQLELEVRIRSGKVDPVTPTPIHYQVWDTRDEDPDKHVWVDLPATWEPGKKAEQVFDANGDDDLDANRETEDTEPESYE